MGSYVSLPLSNMDFNHPVETIPPTIPNGVNNPIPAPTATGPIIPVKSFETIDLSAPPEAAAATRQTHE